MSRFSRNFFQTVLVLTVSTLFTRGIVVYYDVYLSKKIGAFGVGIFELLVSVYFFAKTAAGAGVSLAATRMRAETTGSFKVTMRRILIVCLAIGLWIAALMFCLAPVVCRKLLNDPPGGILALRILSCSLPFISLSSAYGGYFVAVGRMRGFAPIQIFEQLLRLGLTIFLLERFTAQDLSFSICSISIAITCSEVLFFLFSALYYRIVARAEARESQLQSGFLSRFFRLLLPVGGGALFRASLNTIYHILVPVGLKKSGAGETRALAAYGTVQGMTLPVLLYPSALMSAVSLQIVPEIARLRTRNDASAIRRVCGRALRFSLLFSYLCAGVIFFFADGLSQSLFASAEPVPYLRALAPLIPIMYLDIVSDGILKGLDLQIKVLAIGIVDSLLSLTLIFFLLPPFAITGYLVTIYCGESINTLLGQIELRRHVKVRFSLWRDLILPVSAVIASCAFTRFVLFSASSGTPALAFSIVCAVIFCFTLYLCSGCIDKGERHWLWGLLFRSRKNAPACGPENSKNEIQSLSPSVHKKRSAAGSKSRSEI